MCKESLRNETFKFVMNICSSLLYISFFGFICDISDTKSRKHRRHSDPQDEIYLPSIINFELKGRSLALVPVKIKNGYIEKLEKQKHRKCRYIEEQKCNGTGKPKKIYNAQEDKDDPDAGKGENEEQPEDDYPDDYDIMKNTLITEKPTIQTIHVTNDVEMTTTHDYTTEETPKFYNTEGPFTDNTGGNIIFTIPDIYPGKTTDTSHTINVPDGLTTDSRPAHSSFEPTTKSSRVDQTKGGLTSEFNSLASTNEYPEKIPTTQLATASYTDIFISDGSSKTEIDTESVTTQTFMEPSNVNHSTLQMDFTPEINHSQPTASQPHILSTSEQPQRFPNNTAISLPHFTDDEQTTPLYNPPSPTVSNISDRDDLLTEEDPTKNGTWSPIDFPTASSDSGKNIGDEEVEDFYLEDMKDEEKATTHWKIPCIRRTKNRGISGKEKTTRLPHIETPPFPPHPLDLNFPTCSGTDDSLDIEPPSFKPAPERKIEICQYLEHKPTQQATTPKFYKKQAVTRPANAAKKYSGNPGKYAKVLVRIPPSLAELPVVILKDPDTQKLSLSLINGEQAPVRKRPSYYQPTYIQPMFPPSFLYSRNYYSDYNPFAKMYPYRFLDSPSVLYKKAGYLVPKHHGYRNNLRWIRDTYYEDEEEKNLSKSKCNVFH